MLTTTRNLFALVFCYVATACSAAEAPAVISPPQLDNVKAQGPMQTAIFAGGCFWGVQGVYEHVRGVKKAVSGYTGGDKSTAQYESVSTGRTGHAESVQVTFDPAQVTYGQLLHIFFSVAHNPTELNRQGPDHGTQYRSAIFYTDATQQKIAQAYIAQLNAAHAFSDNIVTTVSASAVFYPAEDYHQDFLNSNPNYPYIVYNDLPKIGNLEKLFPAFYSKQAVLVNGRTGT